MFAIFRLTEDTEPKRNTTRRQALSVKLSNSPKRSTFVPSGRGKGVGTGKYWSPRVIRPAFGTILVLLLTGLNISPALADSRSGYTGCYSSSSIRLDHENSVLSSFQHRVEGITYNNGFSNIGLTYTGVRNGNWEIETNPGSINSHAASCY